MLIENCKLSFSLVVLQSISTEKIVQCPTTNFNDFKFCLFVTRFSSCSEIYIFASKSKSILKTIMDDHLKSNEDETTAKNTSDIIDDGEILTWADVVDQQQEMEEVFTYFN